MESGWKRCFRSRFRRKASRFSGLWTARGVAFADRSGDTIARRHTLYPRYVSYADGDFSDVAAVLDKMLQMENGGATVQSAHLH